MQLKDFSVKIPEGYEDDKGYVHLKHETKYTVSLRNNAPLRCAAEVYIDGKKVGVYRINGYGVLDLEHPSGDNGRFTFYELDSKEGKSVGLDSIPRKDRGLISVTFKPEKKYSPTYQESYEVMPSLTPRFYGQGTGYNFDPENQYAPLKGMSCSTIAMNCVEGGTGLSGHSSQNFVKVANLDYDLDRVVTIHLRLVGSNNEPRELVGVGESTAIPSPV